MVISENRQNSNFISIESINMLTGKKNIDNNSSGNLVPEKMFISFDINQK